MKKFFNNLKVRIISCFIFDKAKRKDYRRKNLIDKRAVYSKIEIKGSNNKIIVVKNGKESFLKNGDKIIGLKISIKGDNNTVKLVYPINFNNSSIEIFGSFDSYTEINPSAYVDGLRVILSIGKGQRCIIGENTTSCGLKIDIPSNSSCIIGKDCMFAEFVKLWCGDCHVIMDKDTNEIINRDPDALIIGDHCWIGESSRLLKHTILPNNTIVGACSVVTKKFDEENLIIAGHPAKIVRKNAIWSRDNQCSIEWNKN